MKQILTILAYSFYFHLWNSSHSSIKIALFVSVSWDFGLIVEYCRNFLFVYLNSYICLTGYELRVNICLLWKTVYTGCNTSLSSQLLTTFSMYSMNRWLIIGSLGWSGLAVKHPEILHCIPTQNHNSQINIYVRFWYSKKSLVPIF